MNMSIEQGLASREKCTGCSACAGICPHKAIKMVKDKYGFWYPSINHDNCIECGLCINHCPVNTVISSRTILPEYYAAYTIEKSERKNGSSGNFFGAISKVYIQNGDVVFGAAFKDGNLRDLRHQCSDSVDLSLLQKSKYCECAMGDVFSQIKNKIAENKRVLFCGTPCQAMAIRSVFGDNDKILIVDFICHGVPSIEWFGKYIDALEKKEKSKVVEIDFRDKIYGWFPRWTKIVYESGKSQISSNCKDPYNIDFDENKHLRLSCYQCNRILDSAADISIGDYWAGLSLGNLDKSNEGTSIIRLNTTKGKVFFENIKDHCFVSQLLEEEMVNRTFIKRERSIPSSANDYPDLFPMKPHMSIKKRLVSLYYDGFIKNYRRLKVLFEHNKLT